MSSLQILGELQRLGYRVRLAEEPGFLCVQPVPPDEIIAAIVERKPDLIAVLEEWTIGSSASNVVGAAERLLRTTTPRKRTSGSRAAS
jgi:hypothetical protein